jgi:hypothetical protein
MPSRFTDLEIRAPRLVAPTAWDSLPAREKAVLDKRGFISSREWAPLDQRRFRIEPESYRNADAQRGPTEPKGLTITNCVFWLVTSLSVSLRQRRYS